MLVAPPIQFQTKPFCIGWDMGFYALEPDDECPPEIRMGWSAARERFPFPKKPDRFVRKWVHLRLGAYKRGKSFSDDVTPAYIKAIDVKNCPVLGQTLTHNKDERLNWSIDRIDNSRGYERGNLAVMSAYANTIKSDLSYENVQRKESTGPLRGLLTREHWEKMYDLMSLFYRSNDVNIADLDFFYRGQALVPDAPLNWIMNFQIYISWCISPGKESSGQSLMRIISKQSNQKREFNIMFKRILKKRKFLENNLYLDVWENYQNLENLSRWIQWVHPKQLRYLVRLFGEKALEINFQLRNEHLESLISGK